ncbi:hypothetical protein QYE76_023792 [Lolium multiflorum]|uniref:Uncharacterized protein n=1 Tax=Lolium multiflorum TaxID=4521 RepID=A0AAD8VV36_LOLMU|nr:hypothetical protein QYE76_023792 [Lolium multiflorum]
MASLVATAFVAPWGMKWLTKEFTFGAGILEISGERTVSALGASRHGLHHATTRAASPTAASSQNDRIIEFAGSHASAAPSWLRRRASRCWWHRDPPRWLQRTAGAEPNYTWQSTSAYGSIVEKPKYSSPDKTIKAAKAAVELCESLSGDALAKQQERVRELLETIEQQNAEQLAKLNKAAASKSARSTKNAGRKSMGGGIVPIRTRRREKEMNAQQIDCVRSSSCRKATSRATRCR